MGRSEEIALMREIIGLAERKSAHLDVSPVHSLIGRCASSDRFERERTPMIAAGSTPRIA